MKYRCSCCNIPTRLIERKSLRQGGEDWEDDETELVRYKKPARSNFNRKRTRPCKKSKDGEQCIFTDTKVIGTKYKRDWYTGNDVLILNEIKVCARCGKHGYYF